MFSNPSIPVQAFYLCSWILFHQCSLVSLQANMTIVKQYIFLLCICLKGKGTPDRPRGKKGGLYIFTSLGLFFNDAILIKVNANFWTTDDINTRGQGRSIHCATSSLSETVGRQQWLLSWTEILCRLGLGCVAYSSRHRCKGEVNNLVATKAYTHWLSEMCRLWWTLGSLHKCLYIIRCNN